MLILYRAFKDLTVGRSRSSPPPRGARRRRPRPPRGGRRTAGPRPPGVPRSGASHAGQRGMPSGRSWSDRTGEGCAVSRAASSLTKDQGFHCESWRGLRRGGQPPDPQPWFIFQSFSIAPRASIGMNRMVSYARHLTGRARSRQKRRAGKI